MKRTFNVSIGLLASCASCMPAHAIPSHDDHHEIIAKYKEAEEQEEQLAAENETELETETELIPQGETEGEDAAAVQEDIWSEPKWFTQK